MIIDRFTRVFGWSTRQEPKPLEEPLYQALDRWEDSQALEQALAERARGDDRVALLSQAVLARAHREIKDPLERAEKLNGPVAGATYVASTFAVLDSGYDLRDDFADRALDKLESETTGPVPAQTARTLIQLHRRSSRSAEILDSRKHRRWAKEAEKLLIRWERRGQLEVEGDVDLRQALREGRLVERNGRLQAVDTSHQPGPQTLKTVAGLDEHYLHPGHPLGIEAAAELDPQASEQLLDALIERPDLTSVGLLVLSRLVESAPPESAMSRQLAERQDRLYELCRNSVTDRPDSSSVVSLYGALLKKYPPPQDFLTRDLPLLLDCPARGVRQGTGELLAAAWTSQPALVGATLDHFLSQPLHKPLPPELNRLLPRAEAEFGWQPTPAQRQRLELRAGDARPELQLELLTEALRDAPGPEARQQLVETQLERARGRGEDWHRRVESRLVETWSHLAQTEAERQALLGYTLGSPGHESGTIEVGFDTATVGGVTLAIEDELGLPF